MHDKNLLSSGQALLINIPVRIYFPSSVSHKRCACFLNSNYHHSCGLHMILSHKDHPSIFCEKKLIFFSSVFVLIFFHNLLNKFYFPIFSIFYHFLKSILYFFYHFFMMIFVYEFYWKIECMKFNSVQNTNSTGWCFFFFISFVRFHFSHHQLNEICAITKLLPSIIFDG